MRAVVRSAAVAAVDLIDTMHLGLDRVIGAWSRDGVIVDPGPSSTVETLLAGIEGGEPRAILLTHIHLDHAGATGTLVARFPDLPVYVHEVGAPHLIDPARLLRSAGRLYGDRDGPPLGRGAGRFPRPTSRHCAAASGSRGWR